MQLCFETRVSIVQSLTLSSICLDLDCQFHSLHAVCGRCAATSCIRIPCEGGPTNQALVATLALQAKEAQVEMLWWPREKAAAHPCIYYSAHLKGYGRMAWRRRQKQAPLPDMQQILLSCVGCQSACPYVFYYYYFEHEIAHSLSHDLQNLALLTSHPSHCKNLAMTRPERNNFT